MPNPLRQRSYKLEQKRKKHKEEGTTRSCHHCNKVFPISDFSVNGRDKYRCSKCRKAFYARYSKKNRQELEAPGIARGFERLEGTEPKKYKGAAGHEFNDDNLVCACGITFFQHNENPSYCKIKQKNKYISVERKSIDSKRNREIDNKVIRVISANKNGTTRSHIVEVTKLSSREVSNSLKRLCNHARIELTEDRMWKTYDIT